MEKNCKQEENNQTDRTSAIDFYENSDKNAEKEIKKTATRPATEDNGIP